MPPVRSSSTAAAAIGLDGVVITAAGIDAFECPICQQPTELVVPECEDGHADCPDRACAQCGYALTLTWSAGPAGRRAVASGGGAA